MARATARFVIFALIGLLLIVFVYPKIAEARPVPTRPVASHYSNYGGVDPVYPEIYVDARDTRRYAGYTLAGVGGMATGLCSRVPNVKIPKLGGLGRQVCLAVVPFYFWRLQDTFDRARNEGKCTRLILYSPFVLGTRVERCMYI
jgi:hypothetical protein